MNGLTQSLVPLLTRMATLADAATETAETETAQPWIVGLYEKFAEALRSTLGPPLKGIQEPIDNWLGTVPMSVAMACAIGLFVVALIWTWLIKRDFIFRGSPDQAWWRDLRIWATLVVIPYIAVYLLLGR